MGREEAQVGSLDNKLYILHGWTTSTEKWKSFLKKLESIGIEPVFLDIPGLSAPIDRAWDIDDYVEWLAKSLPDNKHVSVLGHSNGGRILLSFAVKYPERLEQIFLLDSAGIYHSDIITKTKRGVFKFLSIVGKKITNSQNAKSLLYKATRESDYISATPIMKETMRNLIKVDVAPHLKDLQIPVTIIWGKNDTATPYTDALVFKNELPNSTLYTIENAAHSPQFTQTDQVVDIIKKEFK